MISLKKIRDLISENTARYFSHGRVEEVGRRPSVMRDVFTEIYHSGAWGDPESVSGPGSSVRHTLAFRDLIPELLRGLNARSLLDAPCGDFNWMKELRLGVRRYTGVDIVPELVERNRRNHSAPGRAFLNLDITRDRLPRADVVLCRDCLVHFSRGDIVATVRNFKKSKSRYLLTTTFTGRREYVEISTGEWRPLNLQLAPFNFPPPLKLIDERCTHSGGTYTDKCLGLWELAAIDI
ncbi:MAG TPA: class I SAM-dependent methyltransferase [Blastocatellia bacterium]|nr:class I SAM-dependent methyltransferase [Blastocatellia bacterium]